MHRIHFLVSILLLGFSVIQGPWGCGMTSRTYQAPVSVRENPASYTPHYSPRWSTTSSSGGGWSSGK